MGSDFSQFWRLVSSSSRSSGLSPKEGLFSASSTSTSMSSMQEGWQGKRRKTWCPHMAEEHKGINSLLHPFHGALIPPMSSLLSRLNHLLQAYFFILSSWLLRCNTRTRNPSAYEMGRRAPSDHSSPPMAHPSHDTAATFSWSVLSSLFICHDR